jgi:hypothetical protein
VLDLNHATRYSDLKPSPVTDMFVIHTQASSAIILWLTLQIVCSGSTVTPVTFQLEMLLNFSTKLLSLEPSGGFSD